MYGYIYVICPKNRKNIKLYVGSCKNIKARIPRHKTNCLCENNKNHNLALYKHIRENGGWCAFEFLIVEERDDFIDTIDLRKREQYYIDRIPKQFSLNEWNAFITPEQRKLALAKNYARWRKANPQRHAEHTKKWLEKNPAYMRDYMRARYWRKKAEQNERVKQQIV
jgi:group I intron endonuclease